jgi:hypothetical protein
MSLEEAVELVLFGFFEHVQSWRFVNKSLLYTGDLAEVSVKLKKYKKRNLVIGNLRHSVKKTLKLYTRRNDEGRG